MTETITTIALPARRRRSTEEAIALVGEWRSSGLNKDAFCRERGVLRSSLLSCLQRVATHESRSLAPQGFVEVRPSASALMCLALEFAGGMRVVGLDVPMAVALVTALRTARQ